jgi:heat shock protein HslJ
MRQWLLIVALIILASCDETPTTPTAQDVSGRWVVSSLQPANAATITPPDGSLAVEFDGDRLSVRGDCNICSGGYALTGRTITVSALACTRRGCPVGSLDDPFFDLVASAETAGLVGGQVLLLEGRRGQIAFRR